MTKFVLYNDKNGVMYGICDTREQAERALNLYGKTKENLLIREVVYLNQDFISYGEYIIKQREQ